MKLYGRNYSRCHRTFPTKAFGRFPTQNLLSDSFLEFPADSMVVCHQCTLSRRAISKMSVARRLKPIKVPYSLSEISTKSLHRRDRVHSRPEGHAHFCGNVVNVHIIHAFSERLNLLAL